MLQPATAAIGTVTTTPVVTDTSVFAPAVADGNVAVIAVNDNDVAIAGADAAIALLLFLRLLL